MDDEFLVKRLPRRGTSGYPTSRLNINREGFQSFGLDPRAEYPDLYGLTGDRSCRRVSTMLVRMSINQLEQKMNKSVRFLMSAIFALMIALSGFGPLTSVTSAAAAPAQVDLGNITVDDAHPWPAVNPFPSAQAVEAVSCQYAPGQYDPQAKTRWFDVSTENGYKQMKNTCSTGVFWFKDAAPAGTVFSTNQASEAASAVAPTVGGDYMNVELGICTKEQNRKASLDCATDYYFQYGEKQSGFEAYMRSMGAEWTKMEVVGGINFQPSTDPLELPSSPRIWGGTILVSDLKVTGNSVIVTDVPSRIASFGYAFVDDRYAPKPSVWHAGNATSTHDFVEVAFHADGSDWDEIKYAMAHPSSEPYRPYAKGVTTTSTVEPTASATAETQAAADNATQTALPSDDTNGVLTATMTSINEDGLITLTLSEVAKVKVNFAMYEGEEAVEPISFDGKSLEFTFPNGAYAFQVEGAESVKSDVKGWIAACDGFVDWFCKGTEEVVPVAPETAKPEFNFGKFTNALASTTGGFIMSMIALAVMVLLLIGFLGFFFVRSLPPYRGWSFFAGEEAPATTAPVAAVVPAAKKAAKPAAAKKPTKLTIAMLVANVKGLTKNQATKIVAKYPDSAAVKAARVKELAKCGPTSDSKAKALKAYAKTL